ncbi:MAG: DUF5689 domain-containing protein [Clostridiales bacterium]|nr:DUF5689 domain-containing protein [Clostridiales bacterium]
MKKTLLYIAALTGTLGFAACTGDMEQPPMIEPEATITPNTTIADLKAQNWESDRNYVKEIGQRNGKDIVIAGRVVSSDKSGNVFKSIVLQDETGAITVAINAYDLYETYQQGQQIVVNATGLKIGGFNSLMQIGGEGTFNGAPSMTQMDKDLFASHAQQNGLARLERIDTFTVTIPEIIAAKNNTEGLLKWQSQLVRIDNVSFVDAGEPFAGTSATNRYITDKDGNTLNVRNSSYADFAQALLPEGEGSIVAILSYYGSDWQLILNDLDGCIGYGEIKWPAKPDPTPTPDPAPNEGLGTLEAPFTVGQVLQGQTGDGQWVKGYIVGSVNGTQLSEAVFGNSPAGQNNLLLAADAEETDIKKCITVQLIDNDARKKLNLRDNPSNYKKAVTVKGDLIDYFTVMGIRNVTEFKLEGNGYKAVTSITSGKQYAIVADGKSVTLNTGNYGYLMATEVTFTDGELTGVDEANLITIKSVTGGGYTMQMSDARYIYQTGTFTSFNYSASIEDGSVFDITFQTDGTAIITNKSVSKSLQYDPSYGSFGSYDDVRGIYPTLYEKY